jgi:hypothetical protein
MHLDVVSYTTIRIVCRLRILVIGKVCADHSVGHSRQVMPLSQQSLSGKSSLINSIFKVDISVCILESIIYPFINEIGCTFWDRRTSLGQSISILVLFT